MGPKMKPEILTPIYQHTILDVDGIASPGEMVQNGQVNSIEPSFVIDKTLLVLLCQKNSKINHVLKTVVFLV